jgi:hypothetical protein
MLEMLGVLKSIERRINQQRKYKYGKVGGINDALFIDGR